MFDADTLLDPRGGKSNFGTGLITLILGGVVLWVGKATYEHAGQLAGVQQQLQSTRTQNQSLRALYDEMTTMMNDRTKSRFTREDAEKLAWRLKDVEIAHDSFKDRIYDDLMALQIKIAGRDATVRGNQSSNGQVVNATGNSFDPGVARVVNDLQAEVHFLRSEIGRLNRLIGFNRSQIRQPSESLQRSIASPAVNQLNSLQR